VRPRRDVRRPAALAALAIALACVLGHAPARGQVSPGPLAAAHHDLEGNRQCFQCHPPAGSGGRMDDRCLACHGEIASLRSQNRGLHARVTTQKCAQCHPDHGGRDFQLVVFAEGSPATFDHARAGYALEGAHARLECRSCHSVANQRDPVVARMKVKDHARSWLGLQAQCASCHVDPHRGQLGLDCAGCHAMAAWKPAERFDHAKTDYPLTGKHATLACASCHLAANVVTASDAAGHPLPQWKPLAHEQCSSCHRDPHAGRFGPECARCHVTDDFHTLREGGFDHDKTRYPLRGRHATLACAQCHDPRTAFGAKPAFARCLDCHRDAHGGQAMRGGAVRDCADCHDVNGFQSSTFTVAAHGATAFPLAGAHARASCASCHGKLPAGAAGAMGSARVPLHPPHAECTDCHADPHRGRFAAGGARARNEGCTSCHGMEHFAPSRVDAAVHAGFAYALEGAHRAVPCAGCHTELAASRPAGFSSLKGTPQRALAFSDARRRCAECHRSPHGDQFEARKDHGACESCHGLDAFAPASRFDHDRDASFKLEGAHAKTPCARCHPSARAADGTRRVTYRPISGRCESCHATQ